LSRVASQQRYVSETERVEQVVQAPAAHRQAGKEVAKYNEPNGSVNEFEKGAPLDERGHSQEDDCQKIEQQEPVSKPDSTPAPSLVQLP